MAETHMPSAGIPPVSQERFATLVVRRVHVTYRVFQDQRPTLRKLVSNRFKQRRYREISAVRGVSFTAYAGETIGLIGPNGSGKSTLLTAVAGLMPVDSGEIYAVDAPRLMGVRAALLPDLSARRNIILGGLALGLSRREISDRLEEIVDFAGVREHVDLPLRMYSSGMNARLQFAIASTIRPRILFIDESLAVGDERFRRKSEHRLRQLQEGSATAVIVSHDLRAVARLCSRAIWLQTGVVRMDGPAEAVVEEYRASAAQADGVQK